MKREINIFWFRRDLRWEDNHALYKACKEGLPILCIYIYDNNWLKEIAGDSRKINFVHHRLSLLQEQLGSKQYIHIYKDQPLEVFTRLLSEYNVQKIFVNKEYEPATRERDQLITNLARKNGTSFNSYKDHIIFDKHEVVKKDDTPFQVFTPYSKAWLAKLRGNEEDYLKSYPSHTKHVMQTVYHDMCTPIDFNCKIEKPDYPTCIPNIEVIQNYNKNRDYPAINGTSKLSVHLRFGTISIRKLFALAIPLNDKYVSELIWREFYAMILYHFPYTVSKAFKPAYDNVAWESDENMLQCWKEGRTGFPIVDAGMRELNQSGQMHNRVRMIVASFLTKDLLIDWRIGERYFAEKLLDYDQASNVGGWQWTAGTGCDAAPYFRIFNPESQTQKFDSNKAYIKKWVPELGTHAYPLPIIDRKVNRNRTLEAYKMALGKL